jgi:hypothetical protein
LAALIGTLLIDWWSVSIGPISVSAGAWDISGLGKLALLGSLVMLGAVVLMLIPNPPDLGVSVPMVLLGASGFTAVMALLFLVLHLSHSSFGDWLTIAGGAVASYGAYEMGGRLAMPSRTSS